MSLRPGTYVVTGAAGDIGRATADAVAREGVKVVLTDIKLDSMAEHLEEMIAAGIQAQALELDVSDAAQVEYVAELLAAEDVIGLVNIAGIFPTGTIDTVSEADWDRVIDVNLKGSFLTCKAFIPQIARNGGGSIVNISSLAGRTKSAAAAVSYGASKAGIIGLTMLLATQHAKQGIRVNNVAPGNIAGAMYDAIPDDLRAASAAAVPMGRPGDPSEVADSIVYLLSEQSSYITGQTINVNGGIYMA